MATNPSAKTSVRVAALLLPAVCVLGFVFFLQNPKGAGKKSVSNIADAKQSAPATRDRPRRPVPPLYRSPDEVAGNTGSGNLLRAPSRQDAPVLNAAAGTSGGDVNPFQIGSKLNKSAESDLPRTTNTIVGDLEDRVRVIINGNEVQFVFDDEGKGHRMSLVGSFNSWDSTLTPMRREGRLWKATTRLSPIRHEFKFITDQGQWYPEGDNLSVDLGSNRSHSKTSEHRPVQTNHPASTIIRVTGDHQGRVAINQVGDSVRFSILNEPPQDYVLLLGDFNSWNHSVAQMQRQGRYWVTTRSLPPGNYAFKFLGPGENWFPPGDNLILHYEGHSQPNLAQAAIAAIAPAQEPQRSIEPGRVHNATQQSSGSISTQKARDYLNDAGLYEGKPGVWYFPQSNRLVIRQYGRITKDPKIKKALKKLGDRLPHPAEMENPPPRRR